MSDNYFGILLGVLNDEELIRIRHRLKKTRRNQVLVEILTDEIEERWAIEKEAAKMASRLPSGT